jgi:hypothetical protein
MGFCSRSRAGVQFNSRAFSALHKGTTFIRWRRVCFYSILRDESRITDDSSHNLFRRNGLNHGGTGTRKISRVQTSQLDGGLRRCGSRVVDRDSPGVLGSGDEIRDRGASRHVSIRKSRNQRLIARRVGRRQGCSNSAPVHYGGNNSASWPRLRRFVERNGLPDEIATRIPLSPDRRSSQKDRRYQRHRACRLGPPQHGQRHKRTSRRQPLAHPTDFERAASAPPRPNRYTAGRGDHKCP